MKAEINGFLNYISVERGYSRRTAEAYGYDLRRFAEFLALGGHPGGRDAEKVDQSAIRGYLQALADPGGKRPNAPISRGRKLATLKSFFRYLLSVGKVQVDPTAEVRMPKVRLKEASYLSEDEYRRLLKAVKDNATRYFIERDMAIVVMLIGMGLRLTELVELNVGDIDFVNCTTKFTRKGNHEKILPVHNIVMKAVERYLKTRESTEPSAPLFLSTRNKRIDTASVQHLVKKYCREAHIEKAGLSPHTLRHSFAVALLKNGESIFAIQQLLSHQNIHTTQKYLHLNSEDLKTAVNKIRL